jgi:phosphotriesterase-related protein
MRVRRSTRYPARRGHSATAPPDFRSPERPLREARRTQPAAPLRGTRPVPITDLQSPITILSRRQWLSACLSAAVVCAIPASMRAAAPQQAASNATIDTVTGPVHASQLGTTLMHEHVLVDFIGAAEVSPSRYDRDEAFARILPHLKHVRTLGCRTLVECTPAYLGRDPQLLRRLSEASGVQILTNTGYYGAAEDKFVPAHAYRESAADLARRWTAEWQKGIDGTGIKPAFMKIGVDAGRLSEIDAKLVEAAALTTRETGLPIASHTGNGIAAYDQLDLLDRQGVSLSSFIWVHAQNEKDPAFHVGAAKRGAWVEFDGVGPKTVDRHVELVTRMRAEDLLGRTLVSHDAGWYRVGEPGGGDFRPYDTVFTTLVPALKAAGFTERDLQQLLVENPRTALTRAAR